MDDEGDDDDDDDNNDDDNDDDDTDIGGVDGLPGRVRVQMEERQADGGVRGQKGDGRDGRAGHRPGHAGAGHIGQRPVSGRVAAGYVRRGRPFQPSAHPRGQMQRVLRARPRVLRPHQPGRPGPVRQLSAASADRSVRRVPVTDEAQPKRQPDR